MPKQTKKIQISDLPSWQKYFGWGMVNGLVLAISIREGIDVSEEGMATLLIESLRPILESVISPFVITLAVIALGLIGLISQISQYYVVWKDGKVAVAITSCGLFGMLLLIYGLDLFGTILLFAGVVLVLIFPEG